MTQKPSLSELRCSLLFVAGSNVDSLHVTEQTREFSAMSLLSYSLLRNVLGVKGKNKMLYISVSTTCLEIELY